MTKQTKTGGEQKKIYTFLDFEINPNLREVNRIQSPLKISKKGFDILLLLIEKQGSVVTKDEIINRVWPNQVVTDAALNKQITRLRNDLIGHNSPDQSIIETVRGVGVKLVPLVQLKEDKSADNNAKVKLWLALLLVISIVTVAVYLIQPKVADKTAETEQPSIQSFNIVLMPLSKTDGWLNVGGLNYLAEQLQKHSNIQTISPRAEWFNDENTQAKAIEMSQLEGINYILSVNNLKQGKQYQAKVTLRQNQGIVAKESLQATNLSGLFGKIESWVVRQLNISSKIDKGQLYGYQPTDFALESYLRALEQAKKDSHEKAAQLLQTAVSEDSQFFAAWLLLIEIELQLGNYNKALALVTALEQRQDYDESQLNDLFNAKALTLFYLNQLDEATIALEKSMTYSNQKDDVHATIKSLTVLAMIDFNSKNFGEHTVSTLKKKVALIKQYDPDPYKIAVASLNLASVYQAIGQPKQAVEHVNVAIDIFTKENNSIGIVSSTSILARVYNELADPEKSILTLESSDKYFDQIDGYSVQMRYLNNKIEAQLYSGLKEQAEQNIKQMLELSLTNTGNEAKVIALILLIDMDILYQDYSSAKPRIEQLLEVMKTEPSSFPPLYKDMIIVYELYVNALTENPGFVRKKLGEYLTSYPGIVPDYSKEINAIEATLLKNEGFKDQAVRVYRQAMQEYSKVNHVRYALNMGYKILDIQWQNNRQDYIKTMNYLNEIAIFKYPIHKYKAQYLADKKEYTSAYVMMEDLKSKANQFWTTEDQILLEEYQEMAKKQ